MPGEGLAGTRSDIVRPALVPGDFPGPVITQSVANSMIVGVNR